MDSHHQVFARLHPPECPVSTPAPHSKGQKGLLQAEGLRELGQAGNWLCPLALPTPPPWHLSPFGLPFLEDVAWVCRGQVWRILTQAYLLLQPRSSCSAHLASVFHPHDETSYSSKDKYLLILLSVALSHPAAQSWPFHTHSFHPATWPFILPFTGPNLCHPVTHLSPHSFSRHSFSSSSLHACCPSPT